MKKFNRLKDLNTESMEVFYTQVKNAVDFAKNNAPMSDTESQSWKESFLIMKGAGKLMNNKEQVIAMATKYGFIESTDFVTVIQNDKNAVDFLNS